MDNLVIEYSKSINENMVYDLVKELRGDITQTALSEKLGFSFNQVSKWEAGSKKITADEFFQLAEALEIDLPKIFQDTFKIEYRPGNDSKIIIGSVIKTFFYENRKAELQENLGFSKKKFNDFLNGSTKVYLVDFFNFLQITSGRLEFFLARIQNKKQLPDIYEEKLKLFIDYPEALFITQIINLPDYKELEEGEEKFISIKTGYSIDYVRTVVSMMVESGSYFLEGGKLKEKLARRNETMTMTGLEQKVTKEVLVHSLDHFKNYLKGDCYDPKGTFFLGHVSPDGVEKMRKVTHEFSEKVVELIKSEENNLDQGAEAICFVTYLQDSAMYVPKKDSEEKGEALN